MTDDMAMARFLQDRAVEILEAAGATDSFGVTKWPPAWDRPICLGPAAWAMIRPRQSWTGFHRSHEVPNLFICDGSSFASSGRGQPTMTIQALAFRAADHIVEFAHKGEI